MNWKGKPLVSFETIVKLIGETKTRKGLKVASRLDEKEYDDGVEFTEENMEKLRIEFHTLHPKWNYSVLPNDE